MRAAAQPLALAQGATQKLARARAPAPPTVAAAAAARGLAGTPAMASQQHAQQAGHHSVLAAAAPVGALVRSHRPFAPRAHGASAPPGGPPPPAHHAPDGTFRNPWTSYVDRGPTEFFTLALPQMRRLDAYALPTVPLDGAALAAPPGPLQATFVGHACFLVQAGGWNILTDPVFSKRASPVQWAGPARFTPPACAVGDLPPVHVVLLSHNHYDHLDAGSVKALLAKEKADLAAGAGGAGGSGAGAGGPAAARPAGGDAAGSLPPFLQIGSWVGGDRDGNPYVNAGTLEYAVTRQAGVVLGHYLSEVQELHKELALSTRLIAPSPELLGLADAAGVTNPQLSDEPYRRALKGVYARLYETAQALVGPTGGAPAKPPHRRGSPPYATAEEFASDLRVIKASLEGHRAGVLAVDRLDPLLRAVSVFGFQCVEGGGGVCWGRGWAPEGERGGCGASSGRACAPDAHASSHGS